MFDRRAPFPVLALAFAIATVTVAAGCSEGSLSPGNDGGGSGGGGVGGAAGSTEKSPPRCLRELTAACPLAGTCQTVAGTSGATERACYASGETVAVSSTGRAP